MKLDIHWHFQFYAFVKVNENKTLEAAVEVEIVDAETEAEALNKVKEKIERPFYLLKRAWQCSHCIVNENRQNIQLMQFKAFAKFLRGFS